MQCRCDHNLLTQNLISSSLSPTAPSYKFGEMCTSDFIRYRVDKLLIYTKTNKHTHTLSMPCTAGKTEWLQQLIPSGSKELQDTLHLNKITYLQGNA